MTTTLRVDEPRELLALVPHRLGFRPVDSVVAVSLRPPRGQVGVVMRVDVAALADAGTGPGLARAVVGTMAQDGAHEVVLVVYTDEDPRDRSGREVRAVAHLREAAAAPFGDVAAWVVTATGYLSLDCGGGCCPRGGRPLRELESTRVSATMVLAGSAVAHSRDAVAAIPYASSDHRRGVARVRSRWERRRRDVVASEKGTEMWRRASLEAWRSAVAVARAAPAGPLPVPSGRIEAGLADRRLRDAVLLTLIPGTGDLAERSLRGERPSREDDAAVAAALGLLMDAERGVEPPEDATTAHERVLESVVAHGRAGGQAPALTLLAVLAWWRGSGARAAVLVERALEQDPAHHLGQLVSTLLATAVGPGWARRPPAGGA